MKKGFYADSKAVFEYCLMMFFARLIDSHASFYERFLVLHSFSDKQGAKWSAAAAGQAEKRLEKMMPSPSANLSQICELFLVEPAPTAPLVAES